MSTNCIIPLNDLKSGALVYNWSVADEFFEEFGNEEISSARLTVDVTARRTGASAEVDARITGEVTVPCDRCLEDVVMDINTGASLKIRFGQPSQEDEEEDGREVIWIPAGECELDLAQVIYDYVCLALPIQRCHAEGECNPEVLKYLSTGEAQTSVAPADSPFAALKDLIK